MQEKAIFETAMRHLSQLTGIKIDESEIPVKMDRSNFIPDVAIYLHVEGKKFKFLVDVKNEIRQLHLAQLVTTLGHDAENRLLVCQYLSKESRAELKRKNINYLDASGNCFIKKGTLYLYINDQKVAAQRNSAAATKLWTPAGIRLIFAILLNPNLLNENYRTIAKQSKLGLGTVGPLLKEIQEAKYFSKYNNTYQVENREVLINRWTEIFYAVLRPKLVQGKFRFATHRDMEQWQNKKTHDLFWGGEPAGAILTKYLQPEQFIIYSDLKKTDVMKQLHLVPDNNGPIELLTPFWDTETIKFQYPDTVPPLLAYAELITSFDSRNRETAERIKKHYHV